MVSDDGKIIFNRRTGIIRKLDKNDSGYVTVTIDDKSLGILRKRFYVAHLVANAWLGQKPEGYQVDHIDRDKTNNHYKNLRYVTPRTNCRNAKRRGRIAVSLIKGGKVWDFDSMKAAATFIERETGETRAHPKLVAGAEYVYDYKIVYADKRTAPRSWARVIQLSLF